MKVRRNIFLLAGLTFALVSGILIWQLTTLPNLRIQIASGLHNGLQTIADDAAQGLDQFFGQAITRGFAQLEREVDPAGWSPETLPNLRQTFLEVAAAQPLSEAWIVLFPDSTGFKAWEFKKPSRYRSEGATSGSWEEATDLADYLRTTMAELVAPYQTVDSFAGTYWKAAADSHIVLVRNQAFEQALLLGQPIFQTADTSLRAVIFTQTSNWQLENALVPRYFRNLFWPGEERREGLQKRHLQIGVLSGSGNRLIYNSVAYGKQDFAHVAPLANFNSWLSDLQIGVGFRDASVADVAASIYNRNLYVIIGLFVLLMILLVFLFRAALQLIRLSRLKTEFVANVSHEIKTPLAAIKLATDTLKLGRITDAERLAQTVSIIDREAERLQYLITTLLDFSQLEAGKKKYKKAVEKVGEWWKQMETYSRGQAGDTLEIVPAPTEVPGYLRVDSRALEQVLGILLDNARKYGAVPPSIVLRLHVKPGKIAVSVQDFGPGISKEHQRIIFEKFVRLGDVDVHDVKGHGIGLSIAKAIMEDHGGSIRVDSKPGSGSTFTIELPRYKTPEEAQP